MTCRTDGCRQGRDRCPTPALCTDNGGAHVDCGQVVGYESAGIWFAEPEPEIATVADAVWRGVLALLAIATLAGGAAWIVVTLSPLFAVAH